MENRRIDRHDGIREEVVRQGSEHVPFMQVVLCQAIEDCRRAVVNAEDGGLAALEGLYCVLPSDIRAMFKDLPAEIADQRRVQYYATSHTKRTKMTFGGNDVKLAYSPASGKIEETKSQARTYSVPHTVQTWHVQNIMSKRARRAFVVSSFISIMDVLEAKGLLQQTRIELLGNED